MKTNLKKHETRLQICMGINGRSIQKTFFSIFVFDFFFEVFGHKHACGGLKNRFDGLELKILS